MHLDRSRRCHPAIGGDIPVGQAPAWERNLEAGGLPGLLTEMLERTFAAKLPAMPYTGRPTRWRAEQLRPASRTIGPRSMPRRPTGTNSMRTCLPSSATERSRHRRRRGGRVRWRWSNGTLRCLARACLFSISRLASHCCVQRRRGCRSAGFGLAELATSCVGRWRSAQRLIWSRAGRSARPASVSVYVTDTGGPSSTVRTTSPVAVSSPRRSDRTESLMPGTARASVRNPTDPSRNVPSSTPVQRLPSRSNARTSDASAATQSSARMAGVAVP